MITIDERPPLTNMPLEWQVARNAVDSSFIQTQELPYNISMTRGEQLRPISEPFIQLDKLQELLQQVGMTENSASVLQEVTTDQERQLILYGNSSQATVCFAAAHQYEPPGSLPPASIVELLQYDLAGVQTEISADPIIHAHEVSNVLTDVQKRMLAAGEQVLFEIAIVGATKAHPAGCVLLTTNMNEPVTIPTKEYTKNLAIIGYLFSNQKPYGHEGDNHGYVYPLIEE